VFIVSRLAVRSEHVMLCCLFSLRGER